jgi:hypothetical protein
VDRLGHVLAQYHPSMHKKLLLAALLIAMFAACDPLIHKFEVVPKDLPCPGKVTLTWKADGDDLHLNADKPLSPATPQSLPKEGSQQELVTETTTFTAYYPGAGHIERTVNVAGGPNCAGPGPGPSTCLPSAMVFHGICTNSNTGPAYDTQSLTAAAAPGAIAMISSNADFPVHVFHASQEFDLGAGGNLLSPLPPNVPAAGSYTIMVPGQAGLLICQGAGPTSGTTDAPPVTISVTPTCPK